MSDDPQTPPPVDAPPETVPVSPASAAPSEPSPPPTASGSTATPALSQPSGIPAQPAGNAGEGLTEAYVGPVSVGSAPRASGSALRATTPVPIAWRSWPVIDSVWELLGLSTVVVGVPAVVWSSSNNLPVAVACGLVAAFTVWKNYVPTTYEINALGVTSRTLGRSRRIPWISIDRFIVGRKGVFLTSSGAPLEFLRGLYI
ncbi:MAG: hypothetical protein J0M17_23485, partial [Planctomycetes bacterium]|nr:hypothetical protein [Planctomycetota bacterium]